MGQRIPRVAAALLTAQAAYVGLWAGFFPRGFYDSFPGLTRAWVSPDGPYNEHLVRDVGGLYLALAAAGLVALARRDGRSLPVLGAAWVVFGALHLGYHADHLGTLASDADRLAEVVSLGVVVVLALLLLLPTTSRIMTEAA